MDPTYGAKEEGAEQSAATPPAQASHHMGWEPDYKDAVVTLTRFPDFGEKYIDLARIELGPSADRQNVFIRAAAIAAEGIPA